MGKCKGASESNQRMLDAAEKLAFVVKSSQFLFAFVIRSRNCFKSFFNGLRFDKLIALIKLIPGKRGDFVKREGFYWCWENCSFRSAQQVLKWYYFTK
ncbi:hypothetical protein GGTG_11850 [Gaeumannomyces tritici R3-111a-1]|uniref:Uncharacterized protein n=1 Tax=Gaeumannomyces tritici (strain R3-111a-1) TaxID=644352 RepID=J3PEC5_GAET3|nr:hypothetical protein GGTG_11850 [Gaeumannomyces tritici R3-111a-1]EJT70827.1 hypothetical protein GGTG_11850 [Gaeumannomyces tritici R3-111a-1]